jgi:hypothetical protein
MDPDYGLAPTGKRPSYREMTRFLAEDTGRLLGLKRGVSP